MKSKEKIQKICRPQKFASIKKPSNRQKTKSVTHCQKIQWIHAKCVCAWCCIYFLDFMKIKSISMWALLLLFILYSFAWLHSDEKKPICQIAVETWRANQRMNEWISEKCAVWIWLNVFCKYCTRIVYELQIENNFHEKKRNVISIKWQKKGIQWATDVLYRNWLSANWIEEKGGRRRWWK